MHALGDDPRAASRSLDWQAEVLAQGELLSSSIGAAYLRRQGLDFGWCDARDWLDAVSLPNASDWAQRLSVNCRFDAYAARRGRFAAPPAQLLLTPDSITSRNVKKATKLQEARGLNAGKWARHMANASARC